MPTTTITATLIPVTTELRASPGDQLLLVHGVIIGVYAGLEPTSDPTAPNGLDWGQAPHSDAQIMDTITEPMTSWEICNALGLSGGDKPHRSHVQRRLKFLTTTKALKKTRPNGAGSRFYYQLRAGA